MKQTINIWDKPTLKVPETAKILGIPIRKLHMMLRYSTVDFGIAIPPPEGGIRWQYVIFTKKLKEYVDDNLIEVTIDE